ncbi:MAG: ATP-binding protein [Vicinamibacterales bacterium]|nr:ATP-binding protein [Vicinamibacterales bacterium]
MHIWSWGLLNIVVWTVGLRAVYDLRREHSRESLAWNLLAWALWCCLTMEAAMLLSPLHPGIGLVSVVTGVLSAALVAPGITTLIGDMTSGRETSGGRRLLTVGRLVLGIVGAALAVSLLWPRRAEALAGPLHVVEGTVWLAASGWLIVALLRPTEGTQTLVLRPKQLAAAFTIAFLGPALSGAGWLIGMDVPADVSALLSTLFLLTFVSALYAMVIRVRSRNLAAAMTQVHAYEHQILVIEKLAAVSTLAAGAAHDFNNALAVIDGYTGLLLDTPDLAPSVRRDLQQIHTAAQSATAVAAGLLGIARTRTGGRAPTTVREAVLQPLSLLAPEFRRRSIAVTVDAPDTLPRPSLDPQVLSEVCMNLYLNARDAMADRPHRRLIVVAQANAQGITIRIRDTGAGVPASFQPLMFQPLQTTKGDRGTGLGLSVSRRLIEEAGGHIGFATEEGAGTEFTIELPAAAAEPQVQRAAYAAVLRTAS